MNATTAGARPRRARLASWALVLLLAAVAAIPLAALWQAFGPKANLAPDFTLTDQNGRPFTLSSLRGSPVVIFFGYTHCPDTCPTTLAKLARAVRSPAAPHDVRVAFVSVDPARDTPAVLKAYLQLFNPRFVGLTGSFQNLDPVYSEYHTWRQDVPVHHGAEYSVAHGATLTFIGRGGAIRGYGTWDDDLTTMIHDMKEFQ